MMKNEILNEHMNYIVSQILKIVPDVQTILLCGSYGRGEGTWIRISQLESYKPYNDYDLIVVSDSKIVSNDMINALRIQCADQIGIKWVDIDLYTTKEISKLRTIQKNVDIVYGNRVVYGMPIRWNTKIINSSRLGNADIETLYFTRMWAFWGTYHLLKKNILTIDESIFFRNQMAKAILACVDVILIKKGIYDTSYREKVSRVVKLEKFSEYSEYFKKALEEKLSPQPTPLNSEEANKLYEKTLHIFRNIMEFGLQKEFYFYKNKRLFNFYYRVKLRHLIFYLYSILKRRKKYRDKFQKIMILQNNLFIDLSNNSNENIDLLFYANKLKEFGVKPEEIMSVGNVIEKISLLRNTL